MNIPDAITNGSHKAGARAQLEEAMATLRGEHGPLAQTSLTWELLHEDDEFSAPLRIEDLANGEKVDEARRRFLDILEMTVDIMPE